jgi:hypothetical protein
MALRADVIISAGAKLIGPPEPKNTCPDPPHLSLYFQGRGDDFTAGKPNHRWWAPFGFVTIKPGSLDVTVPLSADLWTQVFGRHDPQAFGQAIAQPQAIGLTFGAGCFAGHGLFVTGGTARFHIRSFTVQ